MRSMGLTYTDYLADTLGCGFTKIKIERIEDVLTGKDLERGLEYLEQSQPQQCHYNSAMLCCLFKDWNLSFCEGLYGEYEIAHCWNCLTNKTTGEKRYIDLTLNRENEATLINEWNIKDIINLFCTCKMAFIPFQSYWEYTGKKEAFELLKKYLPKIAA